MDQTIGLAGINVNLSPDAFHRWATHYYKCKQDFACLHSFSPVPYFLLCRAIELEIKSLHLKQKNQSDVKRDFRHNLLKAYEALEPHQQMLSLAEVATLKIANDIYKGKGFEYFVPADALSGYSRYPNLATLDAVAKKLLGL